MGRLLFDKLPHHKQQIRAVLDVLVADGGAFELDAVQIDGLHVHVRGAPVASAHGQHTAVGKVELDAGNAG